MKRIVSIFTLNGYRNYGNRLQLYALSKVLKELGYETEVFWPQKIKQKVKEAAKNSTILSSRFLKECKLRDFTRRHIARNVRRRRDICIYGSDQIWNPNYMKEFPYLFEKNNKCKRAISYAASMGVTSISSEQEALFRDLLNNFTAISVRESSAKELLQSLVGKEIEVVLDPTLLLDKSKYEKLEQKPKDLKKNEKYILCYILGDREQQVAVGKYARDNGLKVILFSDRRDSDYGIGEFLYLIHHAELICTDSFHACVFSFIFERPFVAFKRTGKSNYMYTRLQNLIDTFKLKNREFNGREIAKENLEVDYTEAKKILKKEQNKSLDFLKRALDIKNEN